MNAYGAQLELLVEYDQACRTVLELFDALDAIEILRTHTPTARRYLLDRLETALRLVDRIAGEFDGELECFLDDEE